MNIRALAVINAKPRNSSNKFVFFSACSLFQNEYSMKQIVLILMSILSFSCSSQTQRQATDTTEPVSKKILVAYFLVPELPEGWQSPLPVRSMAGFTGLLLPRPILRPISIGMTSRAGVRSKWPTRILAPNWVGSLSI